MPHTQRKMSAFSLIELMIVVVIIGILSSIAIPQYQQYIARTEASSALATLKSLSTNVDIYISDTGSFPDTSSFSQLGASAEMNSLGTISFPTSASGAYSMVFTFNNQASALTDQDNIRFVKASLTSPWLCQHSTDTNLRGCEND